MFVRTRFNPLKIRELDPPDDPLVPVGLPDPAAPGLLPPRRPGTPVRSVRHDGLAGERRPARAAGRRQALQRGVGQHVERRDALLLRPEAAHGQPGHRARRPDRPVGRYHLGDGADRAMARSGGERRPRGARSRSCPSYAPTAASTSIRRCSKCCSGSCATGSSRARRAPSVRSARPAGDDRTRAGAPGRDHPAEGRASRARYRRRRRRCSMRSRARVDVAGGTRSSASGRIHVQLAWESGLPGNPPLLSRARRGHGVLTCTPAGEYEGEIQAPLAEGYYRLLSQAWLGRRPGDGQRSAGGGRRPSRVEHRPGDRQGGGPRALMSCLRRPG